MTIKVIRCCKGCLYHYMRDLEDDICFEEGGCTAFAPIGLRIQDVEIVLGRGTEQ